MTSSAVSPARTTRSTPGAKTPARSAMTPTRAWCSTAWNSDAAGRVSPTLRSRTARYARYSRSASRWSEPRALTNSRRPSAATAANFLEPLAVTSAGRTDSTAMPARRSQRNAAAEAASEQPSSTIPPISRITSPG
jgi:hypothetical protein